MRIKIVAVGNVTKEKTFFVLPVTYEADGKTQDKKIFSFNTEAYKALKDATAGQFYDIQLLKDKNGYWQWDKVELSANQQAAQAAGSGGGNSRGFETPEERARRQVLIVRQSCLAQSVSILNVKDGNPSVDDVLKVAELFEEWVMRD